MIAILLSITKEVPLSSFIVFAYIDPGSGSIILQFLIATLVGAAFYFRRFFSNVIHFIRDKLFRKPK
jgi:hypothetical protein